MPQRKGDVTKSPTPENKRAMIVDVDKNLHITFRNICDHANRSVSDVMRETIIRSVKRGDLDVFKPQ